MTGNTWKPGFGTKPSFPAAVREKRKSPSKNGTGRNLAASIAKGARCIFGIKKDTKNDIFCKILIKTA